MFYQTFSSKTCFPLPISMPGTFNSSRNVITTNTPLGLKVGNYIYSYVNNEIKKITTALTSLTYNIESAFTSNVVNEEVKMTDISILYKTVSIANLEKSNGLLNGNVLYKRSIVDINGDVFFTIDGSGTIIAILAQ